VKAKVTNPDLGLDTDVEYEVLHREAFVLFTLKAPAGSVVPEVYVYGRDLKVIDEEDSSTPSTPDH
jgi:hypothetical protein